TEQMLRRLVGEHIALTSHKAPDLGRIRADAGQVEQVLVNLVVNARDAMPDGGALHIELSNVTLAEGARPSTLAPGRYVRLSVIDNGSGMDSETVSHIFEPFFTTKEEGRGTGLGLSTVYGIVDQAGGAIDVESEIGRGTSFHVYFPETLD